MPKDDILYLHAFFIVHSFFFLSLGVSLGDSAVGLPTLPSLSAAVACPRAGAGVGAAEG